MKVAIALGVVIGACSPRWIKPEFREEATARAIAAAVVEHSCPRERVSVRCDATTSTRALHGRMVVYDDDGVIGTYVEETPTWEVELEVCGHLRRYRYEPPQIPRVVDPWTTHAPRRASTMVEVKRACGGAYCLGAEPACTNCGRGHWWPVDTMPASGFCANAVDDGTVTVEVVDNSVEIVLAVDSPRDLPRRCGDSPLFVVIDGAWFSLCGDAVASLRPGVHRIPTGITLGINTHGGREHVVQAFDARPDRCRSSQAMRAVLKHTALSWKDLLLVLPETELAPP